MSEDENNYNWLIKRCIETLKNTELYKASMSLDEIELLESVRAPWVRNENNDVRLLTDGKYVPLMKAISINRKEVDKQLEKVCMLSWAYDLLKEHIINKCSCCTWHIRDCEKCIEIATKGFEKEE